MASRRDSEQTGNGPRRRTEGADWKIVNGDGRGYFREQLPRQREPKPDSKAVAAPKLHASTLHVPRHGDTPRGQWRKRVRLPLEMEETMVPTAKPIVDARTRQEGVPLFANAEEAYDNRPGVTISYDSGEAYVDGKPTVTRGR